MTTHTPGPWTANETNQVNYMGDTFNVDAVRCCERPYGDPIAFVAIGSPSESVANAALISAAPDLLESLKDLVKYGPRPEIMEYVNAAIAKAEGR